MKGALLLLLGWLALPAGAWSVSTPPGGSPHAARPRSYDVLHYALRLTLDEKAKTCAGEATITLLPLAHALDTVTLDAAGLDIRQITFQKAPLQYVSSGESLHVALGRAYSPSDTLRLVIAYSVTAPGRGLYFIAPDSLYPGKSYQVWSQGWARDNHFWFPCYDDPNDLATSEVIVTVNGAFTAISNGALLTVTRDTKNKRATYHWRESKPHASYLLSLVAGEYAEVKDTWKKVPLSYFVYPSQKKNALLSFGATPKIMEFYSTVTGQPYAWEKYAQTVVQDFVFGGMENVTATTLDDDIFHDERAHLEISNDRLVAHELAHQWWGNLVTIEDWPHAWLSEGFASYFTMLAEEQLEGRDEALTILYEAQRGLWSDQGERRRPTVWAGYTTPNEMLSSRIYGKGTCILHMLRQTLGDDVFWSVIRRYVSLYAFKNVTTADFQRVAEEVSEKDLEPFFRQWVYKAGYPEFNVTSHWSEETHELRLTVRQMQVIDSLTGVFTTPVEIQVWGDSLPVLHRVSIGSAVEEFSFPAPSKPRLVLFDKGSSVLKKVEHAKPLEEWLFQLAHATDGIDRLLALDTLGRFVDTPAVARAVSEAMLHDEFWQVRRKAAFALGIVRTGDVSPPLLGAARDRDARVRAAAISSLQNFPGDSSAAVLRKAFTSDASYSVAAAALIGLTRVDIPNASRYLREALRRRSYKDVVSGAALQVLAEMANDEARALALEAARDTTVEVATRQQCVRLLSRIWPRRDEVVDAFCALLEDAQAPLRLAVLETLAKNFPTKALAALESAAMRERDPRLARLVGEAIFNIQKEVTRVQSGNN